MKKIITLFLCLILMFVFSACAKDTGGNTAVKGQTTEQTEKNTEEDTTAKEPQVNKTNNSSDSILIDGGKLEIASIRATDGPFVERGDNVQAENVASIVIKNLSGKMLEYGKISFRVNLYERAEFEVSALPAGESAVVMESLARPFEKDDVYECDEESLLTAYKEAETKTDKAVIETQSGVISVKNITDKTISVTVIYKYYENGLYYGGIAFSGRFEEIAPGETVSKESERFGENCKIVNVIIDET